MTETLTVAAAFPKRATSAPSTADTLSPGDIVLGFAGGPKVAGIADLYARLRSRTGTIALEVQRGAETRTATVALIAGRPVLQREAILVSGIVIGERTNVDLVDPILPPLRIEFIKPGELGARSGLGQGDMIELVDGKRYDTVAELFLWLKDQPAGRRVPILVRRGGFVSDVRLSAEYHRLELQITDLKSLSMKD